MENHRFWSIWANYNNSLTWNVGPFWDDSPHIKHDSRVRSPREVVIICINLPRCIMLVGFSLINHPFWGSPIYGLSICGFSPFKSSVRLCRKSCKAFTKCATGGSCKRHGRILGFPWDYTGIGILVGGAITILKNMKVNGKDYPI